MNGRTVFVGLLFCFWVFLAYNAFQRGDGTRAAIYLGVGVALTAYRLRGAFGR
jgi:hypothetical protein